jgi:TonB-linked SusC/RagA family outer membrane protein
MLTLIKQKMFRFGIVFVPLLFCMTGTFAQTKAISGKVVDETGQPVIGATVEVKGTSTGTATDADGAFSINAAPKDVITVSYIGFTTVQVPVGTKTSINVTLKESATELKDVVVVGYGTQKKADLTGAVSTVDVDKSLVAKSTSDIGKGLQGVVPGLQITYANGDITSSPTLQLRGITSLTGGTSQTPPLILVDGIAVLNQDITSIAPDDIASISVLKDAASTSIFGARAVGGVIMITTKSGSKNTKFRVSYTDNFSWGNPTMLPTFADPLQEIPMEDAAAKRAGNPAGFDFWGADMNTMITGITNWKQNAGTVKGNNMVLGRDFDVNGGVPTFYRIWDPVGIMYQTMPAQNHNVNFSGGTDRLSYYVSGTYNYKEGILKPNPQSVNAYNLTASITADVTKWLTLQTKMTDRQYDWQGPYVSSGLIGSDPLYYM